MINPLETGELNTKIQVDLPERLLDTLVVLLSVQALDLKLLNGYTVQGTQTRAFTFSNQSFTRTFTFKKKIKRNYLIGSVGAKRSLLIISLNITICKFVCIFTIKKIAVK